VLLVAAEPGVGVLLVAAVLAVDVLSAAVLLGGAAGCEGGKAKATLGVAVLGVGILERACWKAAAPWLVV